MAEKIKGITIEFRGNTTPLQKAIRTVNSEISKTTKELTSVNKALKFNPASVDLWRQKQELLNQKIASTQDKLDALKQQQQQMDAAKVSKNSEEYRKLEREIIEASSQLKTFKTQLREVGNVNLKALSEGFKQVGSKIEGVGNSLKGVSLAAGAVVGSLAGISIKAGKAADDISTMSKVTGISTDNLQKYSYAAGLVDTSVEAIAKANKKLTKNAYSAANGSKAQAEAFEAIGVSVTDANGNLRDSESIFQDVITNLGKMENETERDAIAQKLMGKSAAELNPLIEDQGETYKKVSETLAKYDLDYIDEDTLKKAQKFNDELDTMKLLGSVAFSMIGSELAGYLAPALKKVTNYIGRFAKWLSKLDPTVLTVVGGIAAFVAILAPLLLGLGKLAFAISSIINVVNLMGGAISLVSAGPLVAIVAAIAAVIAIGVLLYKNWDTIKAKCKQLGDGIKSIWTSVKTAISSAANAIFDAMTWPYRKAWDTIKSVVSSIRNLFPINIGNLFSKIKLPHFSWTWKKLGKYVSIPKISVDWYANGGIFDSPTIAGIGEAGSEAVVPLDKLWDKMDAIAAASSGNGPVINVYATPDMDVNELAVKIEQILVRQQKQRSMAYGGI